MKPTEAPLRAACVYLTADKAVIAAQHYTGALVYYEQEPAILLSGWRDGEQLAVEIRRALDAFSYKDRNLRDHKKTDWPSYKASGCRSAADFERKFLRVWVMAVNRAELFYDASIRPAGEDSLTLHHVVNRFGPDEKIVASFERLFQVCSKWDLMLE